MRYPLKNLEDIKRDMSDLYDKVRTGRCDLKTAAELANIAGKYLKAEQLELAREIFISGRPNLKQLSENDTGPE